MTRGTVKEVRTTRDEPRLPNLWGTGEVRRAYGISYPTVKAWREHPDFPAPACQLDAGPVWIASDVADWVRRFRNYGGQVVRGTNDAQGKILCPGCEGEGNPFCPQCEGEGEVVGNERS